MRLTSFFAAIIAACFTSIMVIVALQLATLQIEAPYLLMLVSIAGATVVAGRLAGALAIVFSSIATWYFFIPPIWSFTLPDWRYAITCTLFVGVGLLLDHLCAIQRREIDDLRDENDALRARLHRL